MRDKSQAANDIPVIHHDRGVRKWSTLRKSLALGVTTSLMVSAYGLPAMADVHTAPAEQAESAASIIDTSILGQELAGGGQTRALFPSGPQTDQGGLDLSLLGSEVIDLGGIALPVTEFIDFGQLGVLNSQSEATDALNARAISGVAGADGAVTLDGADGDFGAARINLLSLFERLGLSGATDLLIDEATLLAGAGGAQVIAENGEFLDPDGFGGQGQYRVAEASLLLHSPTIEQIASDLYDQLGQVDQTMEDTANGMLDLTALASALPGVTLDASIESNMRDEIFAAILAQPITTNNQVLTVDFSTGNITIELDQIYSGERPEGPDAPDGINNQAPNTEVIDDTIYPIIAETVHDLMEEVTNIAVGAIEGALGSVTLNVTAGMTTPLGGATATTSVNLMGDLGEIQCTPSGLGGAAVCTTLTGLLTAAQPILTTVVQPIRDFILSDGGQQIFDTLVGGIKTGAITLPIRMLLSPFFEVLNQAISLQLNRQVVTTCLAPDGSTKTSSLEVSALSLGLAQAVDGARLNLGTAGARIGACAAAIAPAITVDPTQIPAGESTNVDGTGFTPSGNVEVQLIDPAGTPVGTPVIVPADATGIFTTDLPVAADVPPGTYTVRATDVTTGTPVTAPLEILQPNVQELNIGLDPPTVPAGDSTDATGTGYTPNGAVTVQLLDPAGAPVGDPILTTANETGGFTVPVPVPADAAPGNYTVRGTDDTTTNSAEAPLTVVEAGSPILTVDPASVPAGDTTQATGTDYTPNGPVTVQLLDPAGAPVGDPIPTTANETGGFTVPVPVPADAAPGNYTVRGTDDTTSEAPTAPLTVTEGATGSNGSIGDRVWSDLNSDGIQDTGEAGLAGITVNLLDATGNPVNGTDGQPLTDTTDENGAYLFEALELTDYIVEFTGLPTGATFSPAGAGTDRATDSDAAPENGRTTVLTLTAETPATTDIDAGVIGAPAPTEPTVTVDPSTVPAGETTQATGQGFAPNSPITVQLVDAAGNPVGDPIALTTDGEGNFTTPVTVPTGTTPGEHGVKATDAEGGEDTAPLTVTEGATGSNGSIGDRVWSDLNSDGIQDTGEAGLAGITVNLLDATGNPVNGTDGQPLTDTTDENGAYLFEALELTDYIVEFTGLPTGATFSPAGAGTDRATDSDAAPENGRTTVLTLTAETPATTDIDAGVIGAPAPTEPTVTVDPSTVPAGETTQATGQGFAPNSPITVQLVDAAGNPVGDPIALTTDGEGNFTTPVTVPTGTTPGEHGVKATDAEGGEDTAPLTVTEAVSAPAVTVDPTAVAPGEDTQVTGEGFAPNSPATVQLVDADGNPVGEPVEVITDGEGNFTTPLTVPEGTEPGDYAVVVTDDQGGEATTPLTVTDGAAVPAISADPASVPAGDDTEITGTGFAPGSTVTLQLLNGAGNPVGTPVEGVPTNGEGGFVAPLTVPEGTTPGDYSVKGTDAEGGEATTPLTVTAPAAGPSVTVDPTAVAPGEDTQVTGEGFAPNSPATVQLVDADGNPVGEPVEVITDGEGNFTTPLTVPEGTEPGDYAVVVTDDQGGEATTPLTVIEAGTVDPTVAIDPAVVEQGATTQVTGDGYSPNAAVVVELLDADGNVLETVNTTSNADGEIAVGLTVPADAAIGATYMVRGTDGPTQLSAETGLEVIAATAANPNVVVSPDSVLPGEEIDVTGDGYAPNSPVVVEVRDEAGNVIATVETVTDAEGGFNVKVVVPANTPAGNYQVNAKDGQGNEDSAPLTVRTAAVGTCAADPGIAITPGEVKAGGTAQLTGSGHTAGETLTITVVNSAGQPIEIAAAGAAGTASTSFTVVVGNDCSFVIDITIPKGTSAGDYEVIATDKDGNEKGKASLKVTVDAAPGNNGNNGNGNLANTGADVLGLSALALLLILAGAGALITMRVRSNRS